ncbi:Bacterial capsule synthesis protein PGA_cap [Cyanobium gracile PCC 6307]|uniref:Bacterial capsule synthesis protein PGA_cap n=1 Tax=Cyanobium gracile (strain ATCC 27147 / PCC 6307) TaxID=292564 RepID=K9P449_CYAGP|nr:Bacterial capsule synthesis protein PGA_cap [Cyanobium gracile PCC 6307]
MGSVRRLAFWIPTVLAAASLSSACKASSSTDTSGGGDESLWISEAEPPVHGEAKPLPKGVTPERESPQNVAFTFTAFGDAGWAKSHSPRPVYRAGFKRSFLAFSRPGNILGDISYINWETSVGRRCDTFWSKPSATRFAFLTRPEELEDVVQVGFNLIGLANNNSYDCIRSPEGNGPIQSYGHLTRILQNLRQKGTVALFSGVFLTPDHEAPQVDFPVAGGQVPVRFLSAYVGGDAKHCRHIVCDRNLDQFSPVMAKHAGLRVLALHSWDPRSHTRLKAILRSWLEKGLVDIAIGSGPHVAESVKVIQTPRGSGVLATSLGNFIHPSLLPQPNNIALRARWTYDPTRQVLRLHNLKTTKVRCDGEICRKGRTTTISLPSFAR